MHKYRYMKTFLSHIAEAIAKPKTGSKTRSKTGSAAPLSRGEFRDRWSALMHGVGRIAKDSKNPDWLHRRAAEVAVIAPWRLTGHTGYHTNDEIERMKERVFGKIGSSEILFFTGEQGIITFPASRELTHSDIEGQTSLAADLDKSKVDLLNRSTVWGRGRVQHGEVGMVSFYPRPEYRGKLGGMLRSLSRAYPGYQIHDGSGNLYEAVAVKGKKPAAKGKGRELGRIQDFAAKFRKLNKALIKRTADRPNFMMGDRTAEIAGALENPWTLTGHEGHYSNTEIETMKRKVFGSGSERSELFFWVSGIGMVRYPATAVEDESGYVKTPTHSDYIEDVTRRGRILGYGRIEHHNGGRGIISFYTNNRSDLPPALRSLRREFPKYVIHNGAGREYMDESRKSKVVSR